MQSCGHYPLANVVDTSDSWRPTHEGRWLGAASGGLARTAPGRGHGNIGCHVPSSCVWTAACTLYRSHLTVGAQVLDGHNLFVHVKYNHHTLRNALAAKEDAQ